MLQILVLGSPARRKMIDSKEYGNNKINNGKVFVDKEMQCKISYHGSDSIDFVTEAILAVKNHNLQQLECIIGTEGLSVETSDQHGTTLFIVA